MNNNTLAIVGIGIVIIIGLLVWNPTSSTDTSPAVPPVVPPVINPPTDTPVDHPPVPSDVTYEFGAKFEPPDGRIAHAMGQWIEYNPKYLAALGNEQYYPISQLIFVDIGDVPRGWEPEKLKQRMDDIDAAGMIPHIDIGLRGLKPTQAQINQMENPFYGIDEEIVQGSTKYKSRISDIIDAVDEYEKPVIMRIGGEFSGWWNGYQPYEYPKAFRIIVDMFRDAGVENAAFVWCYEPAAADDFDAQNAQGEYKWFPGNDVIDWYCIDVFANKDISGSEKNGNGMLTNYGKTLRFLDFALENDKPVMIGESSPSDVDITSSESDGKQDWDAWFVPYFNLLNTHPTIKWFHYINYDWSSDSMTETNGWKNADISENAYITAQYITEMKKPHYIHVDEKYLLKDYVKYE